MWDEPCFAVRMQDGGIFEVKMRDCKRAGEAGSWLFSWPDESITDLLCGRQDVKSQLKS